MRNCKRKRNIRRFGYWKTKEDALFLAIIRAIKEKEEASLEGSNCQGNRLGYYASAQVLVKGEIYRGASKQKTSDDALAGAFVDALNQSLATE